jgi:phosphoadenosine phosphosulfate reductase
VDLRQVLGLFGRPFGIGLGQAEIDELAAMRLDGFGRAHPERSLFGWDSAGGVRGTPAPAAGSHSIAAVPADKRFIQGTAGILPRCLLPGTPPWSRSSMNPLLSDDEVRVLNERFEGEQPPEILRWALVDSGLERIGIASAFQAEGTCVIHMATRISPDVPILFLETGFHFAETLAFKQQLTDMFDLNVIDLVGDETVESQAERYGPRLYERDPKLCCDLNKVIPFDRALRGLDAWITSLRRDSAWTRMNTPIVDQAQNEDGTWLVKINPMANWTRPEVWRYLKQHEIPHHPLYNLGYSSIGCAPCTRLVFPGEDERAGRWSGIMKTECGIHASEAEKQDGMAGQQLEQVGG